MGFYIFISMFSCHRLLHVLPLFIFKFRFFVPLFVSVSQLHSFFAVHLANSVFWLFWKFHASAKCSSAKVQTLHEYFANKRMPHSKMISFVRVFKLDLFIEFALFFVQCCFLLVCLNFGSMCTWSLLLKSALSMLLICPKFRITS